MNEAQNLEKVVRAAIKVREAQQALHEAKVELMEQAYADEGGASLGEKNYMQIDGEWYVVEVCIEDGKAGDVYPAYGVTIWEQPQ
jgi:hypothetical protein